MERILLAISIALILPFTSGCATNQSHPGDGELFTSLEKLYTATQKRLIENTDASQEYTLARDFFDTAFLYESESCRVFINDQLSLRKDTDMAIGVVSAVGAIASAGLTAVASTAAVGAIGSSTNAISGLGSTYETKYLIPYHDGIQKMMMTTFDRFKDEALKPNSPGNSVLIAKEYALSLSNQLKTICTSDGIALLVNQAISNADPTAKSSKNNSSPPDKKTASGNGPTTENNACLSG